MLMSPSGDAGYSSNGKPQHPSFFPPRALINSSGVYRGGGGVEVDKTGVLCVLTKTDGEAEEGVGWWRSDGGRGGGTGRVKTNLRKTDRSAAGAAGLFSGGESDSLSALCEVSGEISLATPREKTPDRRDWTRVKRRMFLGPGSDGM